MAIGDRRTRWHFLSRRQLAFEALERRDLLAIMRIADWNTLNGPNDATEDLNFRTVFEAIGNETVQGHTQRIDILSLQETDPPGAGDSIGRIAGVLNNLYSTTTYQVSVSPVDGGGDSTGFVYDTSTVSLLESVQVGAGTLTHNIMRGKFQPVGSPASSIFYVYTVHLKSGTTGVDATQRGTEAALLRADADALGEGTQILLMGDFNMNTSAEAAWTNLTVFSPSQPGQMQDVADAPGDWADNPAFKSLHSQDPRTTMDDRFDIHFASGEFFDGGGVDYVDNSFHVFGNNGTHTLDSPITTGTGASVAVLNALVAASDHLPVVADYEILALTPNVKISETLGSTKVVEGGRYDTYQLVLNTVPTSNVVVTVTPNAQLDVGNGAGIAKQFTFTPADALTPQTVVVNGVNDATGEGNHSGVITHTSASSDAAYNGLSLPNVNVSIVDDDAPSFVINELDSDTPGTDALEFVELYDGGVGNRSLAGKSVVFYNGNGDTSYAAFDLDGYFTDANGFFVLGNTAVFGVDLIFSGNLLQNGADAVALYLGDATSFPNGTAVTITNLIDAVVYDTDDADDSGLLLLLQAGQPQVNEDQTDSNIHSIARVPDGGALRQTSTYVAQTPTPRAFNAPQPYGVLVLQSDSNLEVAEGGATDGYQIALQSFPTANVQITVDPDSQTDLGAGAGVAIVLTFTPTNALIPQTINVTAVDDATVENDHLSTITHTFASADARYNGFALPNVVASVTDNDTPAPVSIVISELMYNPASDETSPGVGEWIEVVNTGAGATDLTGWLFDDEDGTDWGAIPSGTVLGPGQVAVFFDSAFTDAATFRSEWSVPGSALVVGVSWGSLGNSPAPGNEVLQLLDDLSVERDVVNYDDTSPWPTDLEGHSIYLKSLSADNNAGANWARSISGTAKAVTVSGPTFSTSDVGSPGRVFLPGDYDTNGTVGAGDYVVWRKTFGSTTNPQADGSGPVIGTPNGVVDNFDYTFWRATFGNTGAISGAGSGAGAGTLLAADTNEANPAGETQNASRVDAGVDVLNIPFAEATSLSSAPRFTRSTPPFDSLSSVGPLLCLVQRTVELQSFDDTPGASAGSVDTYLTEVDELFASLGNGIDAELEPISISL